jgi:UDPglucose 6-dehydrogenase
MRRRHHVTQTAAEMLDGRLLGARIAVLGVAFKPDSDDIRDSPALSIAAALHLQGAQVSVYDPQAMPNAARAYPTLTYVPDYESAVDRADLTMVLTEWHQFRQLDPVKTARMVASQRILDGRNTLEPDEWRAAGWEYRGIGIPTT